ncbi:MAG: SDR family oxidoreductase [Bacteroidota bacterium]
MDLKIGNKIALVTASSKGLGKAVAMKLAEEGAIVNICSRNEADINHTCEEISTKTGAVTRAYVTDVTDNDQVQKMMDKIVSEFGKVDILICNAGGPPSGMHGDFSPNDYRKAVELNLLSTVNLCYSVLPYMKKNKWGRIINITSVSAKQPLGNLILSNTSRAGVLGFAKSLSNQVASDGVTVNCVCPGYTMTDRVRNLAKAFEAGKKGTEEDFFINIRKAIPMNRIGTPEEFADTVCFLASEGAGYITGVSLQIDGGLIQGLF